MGGPIPYRERKIENHFEILNVEAVVPKFRKLRETDHEFKSKLIHIIIFWQKKKAWGGKRIVKGDGRRKKERRIKNGKGKKEEEKEAMTEKLRTSCRFPLKAIPCEKVRVGSLQGKRTKTGIEEQDETALLESQKRGLWRQHSTVVGKGSYRDRHWSRRRWNWEYLIRGQPSTFSGEREIRGKEVCTKPSLEFIN